MSYHRDWEWDEPSDSRQVTIKRYVIPDERDRDHDDFMSRPDYGERGMVVRRHERHHDYDDRKYLYPNRNCPYSLNPWKPCEWSTPDGTKESTNAKLVQVMPIPRKKKTHMATITTVDSASAVTVPLGVS